MKSVFLFSKLPKKMGAFSSMKDVALYNSNKEDFCYGMRAQGNHESRGNGCPRSVIGHIYVQGKDYAARLSVKGEFQIFDNGTKIWQGKTSRQANETSLQFLVRLWVTKYFHEEIAA